MKKNNSIYAFLLCAGIVFGASCERDEAPAPEIIPSEGTKLTLQGGEGAGNAVNAVYVDLSTDLQTSIERKSWDLGFYSGSNFRVIINNQVSATTIATTSTDINAVTSTTFDLAQLSANPMAPSPEHFAFYDNVEGQLASTAIAEIKDNQNDNKVYLVNTVGGATASPENVWKIRVQKNGTTGYTLQYAKINDSNIQTVSINKDNAYNFKFFSFTQGDVQVEPKKDEWDFVWSRSVYQTSMGGPLLPYTFSDLIFTNHLSNTTAAQVIVGGDFTVTYEQFDESHLSQITLLYGRNTIGSTWRATTGATLGAFKDNYYLLKDAANNIYKIKFIAMGAGSDGGTRGYPELEYKLVKRG